MVGLEYLSLFSFPLHSVVKCHNVKNKTEQKSEYKNGMYFIDSKNNEFSRQNGTFTGSKN